MDFVDLSGLSRFKDKLEAVFSKVGHTHTISQVTNLQSTLNGKAASSHSHGAASASAAGFMSATDKAKLDGIATGANKTVVDSALSSTSTNPVQNKVVKSALDGKASTSHTHTSLAYRGSVGATADWDTIGAGVWTVGQSAAFSETYNQPVGAYTYGTLIVNSNGSNVSQVYIAHQNGQMWFRDRFSSTNDFSAWARTYTTVSKPTAADIGAAASSHNHSAANITSGTMPVARGGTGATSAAAARTALGITPGNIGAAASSHTHAASQVTGLTASRALVSDASGHPTASAVTATELGYLDGVTGAIQTQLNGKAASSHSHAAATASAAGLMSAADKSKLDGITRITETEIDALFAS